MLGGYHGFPVRLGGGKPIARIYHESLRSALPSAISSAPGTLADCETLATARMLATAWRATQRYEANQLPGTSYSLLKQWADRLGVLVRQSDSVDDVRRAAAARFQVNTRGANPGAIYDACKAVLGDLLVSIEYNRGTSLSAPPANTQWPANPDAHPWTSSRALLKVTIRWPADMSESEIRTIGNVLLFNALDPLVEGTAAFYWEADAEVGTPTPAAQLAAVMGAPTYILHADDIPLGDFRNYANFDAPGNPIEIVTDGFGGSRKVARFLGTGSSQSLVHRTPDLLGDNTAYVAVLALQFPPVVQSSYFWAVGAGNLTQHQLGISATNTLMVRWGNSAENTLVPLTWGVPTILVSTYDPDADQLRVKVYTSASDEFDTTAITALGPSTPAEHRLGRGAGSLGPYAEVDIRFAALSVGQSLDEAGMDELASVVQSAYDCPLAAVSVPLTPEEELAAILGGTPTTLLHADDLTQTDGQVVTTWPGRTDYDGAGSGSPTVDADGWGGNRKVVQLVQGSTQGIAITAAAAAYTTTTPFTWIFAGQVRSGGTTKFVMTLSNSAATGDYRGFAIASSTTPRMWSNTSISDEFDNGTGLTENVDSIFGITWNGTTGRIVQLTASGETVLVNASHGVGGTWGVNRFTVGFLDRSTTKLATNMRVRAVVELPGVTASSTALTEALEYIRDNFDCPLA